MLEYLASWINSIAPSVNLPTWPSITEMNANPVIARKGCLLLTDDFFEIPKCFITYGENNIIAADSKELTGPRTLMHNYYHHSQLIAKGWKEGFHSINFPINEYGGHNQDFKYMGKTIPLCCQDFNKIVANNLLTTVNGKQAETLKINFDIFNGKAKADWQVKTLYMRDLIYQYIYDGR